MRQSETHECQKDIAGKENDAHQPIVARKHNAPPRGQENENYLNRNTRGFGIETLRCMGVLTIEHPGGAPPASCEMNWIVMVHSPSDGLFVLTSC